MKTLHDAAQAAVNIQSACNMSGILRAFTDAVKILREQPDCTGTDWVNNHPITVLFATQIGYLTKVAIIADVECNYGSALAECERLAKEGVT